MRRLQLTSSVRRSEVLVCPGDRGPNCNCHCPHVRTSQRSVSWTKRPIACPTAKQRWHETTSGVEGCSTRH
eukprot:9730023-Lingulodinium_polyedra.AAC.1